MNDPRMTLNSTARAQSIETLEGLDYQVERTYGDKVVLMSKQYNDHPGGFIGVFIWPDGTVKRPHCLWTQIAQSELHEAGVKTS